MESNTLEKRHLKITLSILTFLLIMSQFYVLSLKLPFDIAFNNKTVGFFAIYINTLKHNFLLWPPLIYFLLAHILIQSIFSLIIYFFSRNIVTLLPSIKKNIFLIGILLWFLCVINVYLWNAVLFPYSFFSMTINALFVPKTILYICLSLTSLIILIAGVMTFINIMKHHPYIFLAGMAMLMIGMGIKYSLRTASVSHSNNKYPNIILIITDSLRPDYIKTNHNPSSLQHFLKNSAFFKNSLSLLGRSTPGLASILTGNYPKISGARFNLMPNHYLHLENSLTCLLKSVGYQTVFAADGKQFINLDKSYHFDQIICPKSGVYDFIFSLINDTPLSNLLTNTFIGKGLFPYNYANRHSYFTYMPNTFLNLFDQEFENKNPQKPVLLVIALTVAHWPYVWARQPNFPNIAERYEESVQQLDKQFRGLIDLLKNRGLLNNSIIVTLSDHGDSLGLPGDRIITPKKYEGPLAYLKLIPSYPYTVSSEDKKIIGIDTSVGHGTDLLSLTQLQTTLAIYQQNTVLPGIRRQRVALIDIMPTLLDLLNLKSSIKFDGKSLLPLLKNSKDTESWDRPLFLETEIDIPLIDITKSKEEHSSLSRLINQYAKLYDINPMTQQLELKDDAIPKLLKEKQRGILDKEWLLAKIPGVNQLQTVLLPSDSPELKHCYYSYPTSQKNNPKTFICYRLSPTIPYYVLVNLRTKVWRIYPTTAPPNDPIFNHLFRKLKLFYGEELVSQPPITYDEEQLQKYPEHYADTLYNPSHIQTRNDRPQSLVH